MKNMLMQAKVQFIDVCIENHSGWLDEYFELYEIKDVKQGVEKITLIILRSSNDSVCMVVDLQSISCLKFNNYLNIEGNLIDKISILQTEAAVNLND